MTVSQKRYWSTEAAGPRATAASEGLQWLGRQLVWEAVLARVRVAAGLLPGSALPATRSVPRGAQLPAA